LKDVSVLRDQLLGVDYSYMLQFISALESHQGEITSTYIAELVDKMFD